MEAWLAVWKSKYKKWEWQHFGGGLMSVRLCSMLKAFPENVRKQRSETLRCKSSLRRGNQASEAEDSVRQHSHAALLQTTTNPQADYFSEFSRMCGASAAVMRAMRWAAARGLQKARARLSELKC